MTMIKQGLEKLQKVFLDHHANLSSLDGDQMNKGHPLAFVAGGQGPNPNIRNIK